MSTKLILVVTEEALRIRMDVVMMARNMMGGRMHSKWVTTWCRLMHVEGPRPNNEIEAKRN